jgi:hypothetical protein
MEEGRLREDNPAFASTHRGRDRLRERRMATAQEAVRIPASPPPEHLDPNVERRRDPPE